MRNLLVIIFKHKMAVVATFVAILAIVMIGTYLVPPVYESTATLLIKFGREYVYLPKVSDEKGPGNYFNREGIINNEIEILSSEDLLENTVKSVGVGSLYPDLEKNPPKNKPITKVAAFQFRKALSIQGNKDADIIRVSLRHGDAQIAAKALSSLVDGFKGQHLAAFGDVESQGFLEKKVTTYEDDVRRSENDLISFKEKFSAFSMEEQIRLMLAQQAELDASLSDIGVRLSGEQQRATALATELKKTSKEVAVRTEPGKEINDVSDRAKDRLIELRLKEQELSRNYLDENRQVVSTRKEIALVDQFIRDEEGKLKPKVTIGINDLYQELSKSLAFANAEVDSLRGKQRIVQSEIQAINKRLASMLEHEQQLKDMERDLSIKQENYRAYRNKLENARISKEMDLDKMTNISVIQAATVPIKPVWPIKPLNFLIGIVLGMIGGIGVAFAREAFNPFVSAGQITEKRLGVPVLAVFWNEANLG